MSPRLFYLLALTPVAGPSPLWLVLRHPDMWSPDPEQRQRQPPTGQHFGASQTGWTEKSGFFSLNSELNISSSCGKGQYFLTGVNSGRIICCILCEVTLIVISITRDGLSPQYFYHIASLFTLEIPSFHSQPASHIIRIWAVPITWYLHDPRDRCVSPHLTSPRVTQSSYLQSFDCLSPHLSIPRKTQIRILIATLKIT